MIKIQVNKKLPSIEAASDLQVEETLAIGEMSADGF
jgi:hypothetical protein